MRKQYDRAVSSIAACPLEPVRTDRQRSMPEKLTSVAHLAIVTGDVALALLIHNGLLSRRSDHQCQSFVGLCESGDQTQRVALGGIYEVLVSPFGDPTRFRK